MIRPACCCSRIQSASLSRTAWSVSVAGTRPRTFPGGEFGMACLLVLKRLPQGGVRDKEALNDILRDHGVDG